VLISAFLLAMAGLAQGRTITVGHGGGYDFNTIQAAIDDSNDGDTTVVADGIYIGAGNKNLDFEGRAITVRSENGSANCIIDCEYDGRGFYFSNGETASSVLDGFTIRNGSLGWGRNGGGIYCNFSSPTITNCTITGNSAGPGEGHGGGIYCYSSSAIISNCTITGNSGITNGGGIYTSYLSSSPFSPTIGNCTISGNTPSGIVCFGSSPSIINCISSDNTGVGVLCAYSSSPTITNCTISKNSGSGIACVRQSSPIIKNSTITGNSDGGMHTNNDCHPTLTNCTFIGNSATVDGSGIVCYLYSSATITNCILWDNWASSGAEMWFLVSSSLTVTFSDVEGGQSAVAGGGADCTLTWGLGNIDADPYFAKPGYWGDANDPNIIVEPNDPNAVWIDGDYHLQSQAGRWDPNSQSWVIDGNTSPCIDAGNPGCLPGSEPAPNGNRINMGAFGGTEEASKSPADWRSIADLTNDWTVDFNDLKVFVDYWLETGECIPSDLNRSQFVDFVDFAIFGQQWAGTPVAKPAIEYEIFPCDQGLFAAGEAGQTRFSAVVEGRYIHFEDMMTANCCPDELELIMTVEDNLITIHEIEHLTTPCFCICDYPVTATLGPFEEGTYILEVYEDWSGFIGSTVVTIGPADFQAGFAG